MKYKPEMATEELGQWAVESVKIMTSDEKVRLRSKILKEFGMMPTKVYRVN
jgi:hypothetical protein